jgi:hypothetical protein
MEKIMNFFKMSPVSETLEYAVVGAIVAAVALLIYGSAGVAVFRTL